MPPLNFNNLAIEARNLSWDKQFLQGEEAKEHIGRILEFFKTTDGENYFRVQWFYRAEDTVSTEIKIFLGHSIFVILTFVTLLLCFIERF